MLKIMRVLGSFCLLISIAFSLGAQSATSTPNSNPNIYLDNIKEELVKEWPNNRTINLVFHGHSVPAGYFKTPVVNTLAAYPYQVLQELKELYPTAVINMINTSIGGEHAISGAKRFKKEVLTHRPDVLFIDYALNDLRHGLSASKTAWSKMIKAAQHRGIKVILLTPSPNLKFDILEEVHILAKHAQQVRDLAKSFNTGLVDSYLLFQQKAQEGVDLRAFMSQGNHPNEKGHGLIATALLQFFQ
ncbi:MAG: SGNH/GDSL hydrolase family protein [Saprospiraceae bacterium]|nr:SGNH/GDSL hydrolase family protein [Saprospiraceae bacterium]